MNKKSSTKCRRSVDNFIITSPLCEITVVSCDIGLHSLSLHQDLTDKNFNPSEKCHIKLLTDDKEAPQPICELIKWLNVYFKTPNQVHSCAIPNMCPLNDEKGFYNQVWRYLSSTIKPGQVITYGDIAKNLSNPGATRAVGSAMRNNPLGIIVPCHRVVAASGLGLYCGGSRQKVKVWLLKHEGIDDYSL